MDAKVRQSAVVFHWKTLQIKNSWTLKAYDKE